MMDAIGTNLDCESVGADVLSFVQGRSLWVPERDGRYDRDCATGRFYASELVEFIRATGRTHLFGFVGQAIARSGQWGGVEIGFYSEIAQHLEEN